MSLPNDRDGREIRMCDLIDLSSPDVKETVKSAKLASPLIPPPKNVEEKTESATEKREGDGNNPFDRVLHETVEYVSKKGDPFEVMLQRALRPKDWRNAHSVDFTDDFTPRRKKRYLKTINKTLDMLDESLLEGGFGMFDGDKKAAKSKPGSVNIVKRNIDVCDSNAVDNASVVKQEHKVSAARPDSLELSILNYSVMNDTLLEALPKPNEDGMVSPFPEKDALFEFPSNAKYLKLPNVQRSLSQGARKSPIELPCSNRRSQSMTDGQRKASHSVNSTNSSTISSFLDRGFLKSKLSEQSVFSTLSNVSSITKLTSASLSSILSNDAMNHAFLDNGSLKTSQEKISGSESSVEVKPRQYDLSDLAEKLNKLKYTMSDTASISCVTKDDSNSLKEEANKWIMNNKLIDVDVFVPENMECNRSSSSTCSSDSVFINTSKVDKSILNEAKVLAKTFEELAIKTDSGSIDDDLISNNTLWISELLPAFEDEPVVDDLIDLPVSPEQNSRNIRSNNKQSPASIDSTEDNSLKKLESFSSVSVVKQDVTSLLLDLRKLIKTESNPEAKKLLDNLENVLDVNYKNNTELLVTYLNTSNKSRSPQKMSSDSIERFNKSNTDKSEEESGKSSEEKRSNNEKSLQDINYILEDISQNSSEKSSAMSLACKDNEDYINTANSSNLTEHSKNDSKEKDSQVDKKIAIELLINLQKLLSGQAEDDTTIQLLKNIGKALNTALNNNVEDKIQANCTRKKNVQQTTPVKTLESDRNTRHSSAISTKVSQRRSLEPKSKTVRRSISAVDSSPKTSSSQIRRHRETSELENRQNRFSSPGFINNLSNKKSMISEANTKKAEVTASDSKKEKSTVISDVKNKLKKRSDVVSKRGPLKAVHPVDNMQKKASLERQKPSSQATPPKSNKTTPLGNKIISSTPNSPSNNYMPKKSMKSKPIASSTPDGQNSKTALTSANKKRNLSCDISPVTTHVNMSGSDERKDSPKRTSKLPTPKKCTTPTDQRIDIPKFLTPPRHYSNMNNPQSPQRLNKSLINLQRYSPIYSEKNNVGKKRQSPLKDTNRITAKVKPLNLISKIKRHSTGDFAEKENNYV